MRQHTMNWLAYLAILLLLTTSSVQADEGQCGKTTLKTVGKCNTTVLVSVQKLELDVKPGPNTDYPQHAPGKIFKLDLAGCLVEIETYIDSSAILFKINVPNSPTAGYVSNPTKFVVNGTHFTVSNQGSSAKISCTPTFEEVKGGWKAPISMSGEVPDSLSLQSDDAKIYVEDKKADGAGSLSMGAIIGISVAAAIALLIICAAVGLFFYRRHKRARGAAAAQAQPVESELIIDPTEDKKVSTEQPQESQKSTKKKNRTTEEQVGRDKTSKEGAKKTKGQSRADSPPKKNRKSRADSPPKETSLIPLSVKPHPEVVLSELEQRKR